MKNQNIITKENLIKDIAKQNHKTICETKDFYNAFENIIFNNLSTANEDKDVRIKLFEGINLDGIFIPEKTKKNNLTGQINFVHSKIKPKFTITRSYCEKLNNK